MACKDPEMAKLIGEYERGVLPRDERDKLEAHLLECNECFQDLYEMAPVVSRLREQKSTLTPAGETAEPERETPPEETSTTDRQPSRTFWRWSYA
ncbi:zf-HC2 domain-containing protein, partial [Acidobacteriota bacterium]